jgi:hypothetical protein
MINDPEFIKLMSECMKEIDQFNPSEISEFLHILVRRIGWKDLSLLKMLEGTVVDRLPSMDPASITRILESYSGMRCGSRTLWESQVSSIVSLAERELLDSDLLFRVLYCIDESIPTGCLYKPVLLLRSLHPLIVSHLHSGDAIPSADLARLATVYSHWPKAVSGDQLRDLLKQVMKIRTSDSFDLQADSRVFQSIVYGLPDCVELDAFIDHIQTGISSYDVPENVSRSSIRALVSLSHSLYKRRVFESRETFATLESIFEQHMTKVSSSSLPTLAQIYARMFGLVNPYIYCVENFGPPATTLLGPIESVAITGAIGRMSIRELARMGEGFAVVRKGSPTFWAAVVTRVEALLPSSGSELAPEEIAKLMWTFGEMDLELSRSALDALVTVGFEKIHLLEKYFAYFIFFINHYTTGRERVELVSRVLQLVDREKLLDGSGVLLDLVLQTIPEMDEEVLDPSEVHEYQSDCRAVMTLELVENMTKHERLGGTVPNHPVGPLLADAALVDSKVAYMFLSPVQETENDKRVTGTFKLMTSVLETHGWTCHPVSASLWAEAGSIGEKDEIIRRGLSHPIRRVSDTPAAPRVYEDSESIDISPLVQRDRVAAHRSRAPPAEALPWVSSVVSLKKRKKSKKRT